MSRLRVVAIAGAIWAAVLVSSCSGRVTGGRGLDVVVGLYPYQYVAERVVGNHGTVTNLTKPGAEPHDLELTPRQVAAASTADLAIYEKGLQPSFDTAIKNEPPRHELDVTMVVPLQDTAQQEVTTVGDRPDESAREAHTLAGDPHVWQDPVRMATITRAIRDQLVTIDPGHKMDYIANARKLLHDLRTLDRRFTKGLAHCTRTEIVTSHAAFGYLAQRYHLTMISIAGLSPDNEPSAEWIAQLQRLIARDGLTTVFSEELGTKKYAQSLAHDLGLKAEVLSPIEGLQSNTDNDTYVSLMDKNLRALRSALGCR
jgi:zinc transport system substrate-binding protein